MARRYPRRHFLSSIFALALAADIGTAAAQSAEEVLEGVLEVLIEDSGRGSRTAYFLARDSDRIALRFTTPPRNLRTGTRIRVRGNYETGGAFRVTSVERVVPAG